MNASSASVSLMQTQALGSLMSSMLGAKRDDSWASIFSLLAANGSDQLSAAPLSALTRSGSVQGIAPTGRNMALSDPESAYQMMTLINNDDVLYKAQFSELSQMKSSVLQMQDAGQGLGGIALSAANDSIKSRLQDFVGQYNNWIQRFGPDVQKGGLLGDTQAAQASRFELEQNLNNPLFGARDGVQGLRSLGITVDPATHLASMDSAQLDSVLANNKQGVVDALHEFGANFAKSANLLNSDGNFILSQLDNLNRAIHFIADNKTSLQQEFGTGTAARPTGQVARALAAYNQAYAIPDPGLREV